MDKTIDEKLEEMDKNLQDLVNIAVETRKEADEAMKEAHELWWTERLARKAEKLGI